MELLQTVLSFILALGFLVTIHEYGHFWVARKCGVRVLRFSVGFGNPLFRWTDKKGTEYWIASIPLGGYVKMLDSREVDVPPEQMHEEFNQKNVWQRMAIFAAGPGVNLLFAVLFYWFMFLNGVSTVAPVIGDVEVESMADRAGLKTGQEIIAIDGNETPNWQQVSFAFIERVGETGEITVSVKEASSDLTTDYRVPINNWMDGGADQSPYDILGFAPYRPFIPAQISKVQAGSPAEKGGLVAEDIVKAVNGEPIEDWEAWVNVVRDNPAKEMAVEVDRAGSVVELTLIPDAIKDSRTGEWFGRIGAHSPKVDWPEDMVRRMEYSVFGALVAGVEKTANLISLIFKTLWKMVVGEMSLDNISGPITIAQVAGDTARDGLNTFFNFLAYLSISLGVFNLLPIPVLDGGHLLFAMIEAARGKPLSERIQNAGLSVGLSLLAAFMVLAIYNDIVRIAQ